MEVRYNQVLQPVRVTVVVPTLGPQSPQDTRLLDCLSALARQTCACFHTVVVDNSGTGAVARLGIASPSVSVLTNGKNAGFGAAINQGFADRPAEFLAVLNDDAIPEPGWLESLLDAIDSESGAGMAASRVLLAGTGQIDSAGLAIARDGSSKQIAHGWPAAHAAIPCEVLIPSGCAAIYRSSMLEEIGLFEESFFLYCEDTDLALRGHWSGWSCLYVPTAVVEHHYSASAGRASALKAYLVERNRLRVAIRCFPMDWLIGVPVFSLVRYFWHVYYMFAGRGIAAEFARNEPAAALAWYVTKAHLAAIRELPDLLRQRRSIFRRVQPAEVRRLLRLHLISLREVASQ